MQRRELLCWILVVLSVGALCLLQLLGGLPGGAPFLLLSAALLALVAALGMAARRHALSALIDPCNRLSLLASQLDQMTIALRGLHDETARARQLHERSLERDDELLRHLRRGSELQQSLARDLCRCVERIEQTASRQDHRKLGMRQ